MNETDIVRAFTELEYITPSNTEKSLYERFNALKNAMLYDPKSNLNRNKITGIWYLADFGSVHPHIIIRSPVALDTVERMLINHGIWNFILNENQYDYLSDVLKENEYIGGLTKILRKDIVNKRAYVVYDAEREEL